MTPKLALVALSIVVMAVTSLQRGESATRKRFVELADKNDAPGIVALWKSSPGEAIGTIDVDLEGFLAQIEKGSPDLAEIQKMKDRALLGARCADEALGRPIFSDYASSFAGWSETEQKEFRQGQRLASEASKSSKANNWEAAQKQAQECVNITKALGDWWGLATGYSTLANAHEGLGQDGAALEACQMARILHHDMEMQGSELRDTVQMTRLLVKMGRATRARAALDSGLTLATKSKNAKAEAELKELLAKIDKK